LESLRLFRAKLEVDDLVLLNLVNGGLGVKAAVVADGGVQPAEVIAD
jgi:hypothetical protein